MRGVHRVTVRNRRVQFTLELERNITVIRGDSATGKTTLMGMLRDYEEQGIQSGVSVLCDKPCRVLSSFDWESRLRTISDSIVFVDEGNAFVNSQEFAQAIRGTSNYYVLITRESLYQLPYSVESVLELRKTTSRSKRTYNKAYPYYKTLQHATEHLTSVDRILTEDSNAGHQMFSRIAARHGIQCDSALGKSNVFGALMDNMHRRTLVIADGAAFGADMEKVYQFLTLHPGHVTLYLPESFEWLLLKAGIIRSPELDDILSAPADHIDSDQYFSWEQFFTALLINLTSQRDYMRYNKQRLPAFYLQDENVQKVLDAMETD